MKIAVTGSRIFADLTYIAGFTSALLLRHPQTVLLTTTMRACDSTVLKTARYHQAATIVYTIEGDRDGYRLERSGTVLEHHNDYRHAVRARNKRLLEEADAMIIFQQLVHGRPTPETTILLEQAAMRLNPTVVNNDGYQQLPPYRELIDRLNPA